MKRQECLVVTRVHRNKRITTIYDSIYRLMIFGPRIEKRVVRDIPMAPKDEWLARVAMATPQICSRFGEADGTWNETHVPYRERTLGGSS
ncbi:unnamed protein product [Lasius platythorax]|uniref:Uncharacterized protein n=1 Tax=Lasius platythorax TaxID=488582 RepID=A0AAV2N2N3_9HYME